MPAGGRGAARVPSLSPCQPPLSCSAPQEILNYISRKEFEPLLKVDQLNLEKEKHKVFLRFGEGEGPGRGSLGAGGAAPDPP